MSSINLFPKLIDPSPNDCLLIWDTSAGATKGIELSTLQSFLGNIGDTEIINLTWVSNGDNNGLFYYLGSNGSEWKNPSDTNIITAIVSSGGFSPNLLFNRTLDLWYTSNSVNSWIAIDIGQRNFILNKYAIRHDDETGYYLRNWKLQGSNNVNVNSVAGINAATWIDLDTRINDVTINSVGGWGSFNVNTSNVYRWLRLLQNGVNSSSDNYLVMSEIELYGTLTL
jgi:hypothetical protein